MVLMQKPSVIDAPSGGAPEQAPRWDLVDTESCGRWNQVFCSVFDLSGVRRYIQEEEVRRWPPEGPTRQGGVPYRGVHPTLSWPPRLLLDLHSKSSGSRLFQKSRSRRFHSIWTLFDIRFLRNTEIGKKTTIWVGPPVSRLVPKMI